MKRLVCKSNPHVRVTAPDDMIVEVQGNCWMLVGSMLFSKSLWQLENCNVPEDLDVAAGTFAIEEVCPKDNAYENAVKCFKAGAMWDRSQEITKEYQVNSDIQMRTVDEIIHITKEHEKDFVPDNPMGPNILGEFRRDKIGFGEGSKTIRAKVKK